MGEATRKLFGPPRVAKEKESERFDNGEKTLKKRCIQHFYFNCLDMAPGPIISLQCL